MDLAAGAGEMPAANGALFRGGVMIVQRWQTPGDDRRSATAVLRPCRSWVPHVARTAVAAVLAGVGAACGPTAADDSKLPPDVQDPASLHNEAGALELYRGALLVFPNALDEVMVRGAILTDELAALPMPTGLTGVYTGLDSRQNPVGAGDQAYARLHRARAQLREARGFLAAYVPDTATSRELQGHLYAIEGYADLLLADLFCSGIPLSTVDFNGDYTLAAGSTTEEVYERAVALFDTASALTQDSAAFHHLAAVGRARSLLALGRYAEAGAAVAAVPSDFRYQVTAPAGVGANNVWSMWRFVFNAGGTENPTSYRRTSGVPSTGDLEGINGLDYRTSGDPRTAATRLGADVFGHDMYFPMKYYPVEVTVLLTLADGVEARLIEAEAALQGGGGWLAILNALRTDGTFDTQPNPEDTTRTDTLWHAGVGGVAGLRPLDDPGADAPRVDLVFRERAFWLYLTAHRQGDLRRLVRVYRRASDAVYPTGPYPGGSGTYGHELVIPVPDAEQRANPEYTGCLHRNA